MNDYRYLNPKRVKMFLYPSDDVFVPTNWLFYSPTKYVSCSSHEFSEYPQILIHRYCSYELPSGGKHKRSACKICDNLCTFVGLIISHEGHG